MQERNISPEESLQIIQKMIDNSRLKVAENGFHLIVWAIMISIASICQYLMITYRFHLERSWLMWIGAVVIGFTIGNIYEYRRHKNQKIEKNKMNRIVDFIWMSFGISSALVWLIAFRYSLYDITPLIHISLGAATFISGIDLQIKSLNLGGIIFWDACIICVIISSPLNLLINAAAMIIGFLTPGIQLWKKYKIDSDV